MDSREWRWSIISESYIKSQPRRYSLCKIFVSCRWKKDKFFESTTAVSGQTKKHGIKDVIPDSVTDNAFFEVKDVKKLNNSPQIEAELDAAINEGKEYYIITGKNTKIAPIIESNKKIKIIRMEGIGPK